MLVAMRIARTVKGRVRVWSDNQAVVRITKMLLHGGTSRRSSHRDLVVQLEEVVQDFCPGFVTVHKVTSHCDGRQADGIADEWAVHQNALVDHAASEFNFRREERFWDLWFKAADSIRFQESLLSQIQLVLLRVGKAAVQIREQSGMSSAGVVRPVATDSTDVPPHVAPSGWSMAGSLSKLYLHRNVVKLHSWWSETGARALKSSNGMVWVSGIQLFIDFVAHSGHWGMLSPRFHLWFDSEEVAPITVKRGLSARATMFLRLWNAYLKVNRCSISHRVVRPESSALAFWTMSWFLPWSPVRIAAIDTMLLGLHGRQFVRSSELDQYEHIDVSPGFSQLG